MYGRESSLHEQMTALQCKLDYLQRQNDGLKGALVMGTSAMKKQWALGHCGSELEAALASADAALEAVEAQIHATFQHGKAYVSQQYHFNVLVVSLQVKFIHLHLVFLFPLCVFPTTDATHSSSESTAQSCNKHLRIPKGQF